MNNETKIRKNDAFIQVNVKCVLFKDDTFTSIFISLLLSCVRENFLLYIFRIYADVVINHMTGDNPNNTGTAGNKADFKKYDYPAVPYHKEHFHYPHCIIENYNDANQVLLVFG